MLSKEERIYYETIIELIKEITEELKKSNESED